MVIRKNKKSFAGKIFSFKLFLVTSVALIIILGIKLGGIYYIEYQIQKEIDSLRTDIEATEKNNYEVSQLIEYAKTDEYKEAEARKRFNMQGEGESVVIIRSGPDNTENIESREELVIEVNAPNYIQWWNYFFASK